MDSYHWKEALELSPFKEIYLFNLQKLGLLHLK